MADKDENLSENPTEKPKGGGKKLLVIGLFLGLVIGGAIGGGAFMLMGGGGDKAAAPTVVVEKKPKTDPHFVKVERVTIPLIGDNRILGTMMMDFSLEVDGNDNKMKVVRNLPEIRDALLRHFSQTPVGKPDNPGSVDYPRLKQSLKEISNRILHGALVKRVMVVKAQHF